MVPTLCLSHRYTPSPHTSPPALSIVYICVVCAPRAARARAVSGRRSRGSRRRRDGAGLAGIAAPRYGRTKSRSNGHWAVARTLTGNAPATQLFTAGWGAALGLKCASSGIPNRYRPHVSLPCRTAEPPATSHGCSETGEATRCSVLSLAIKKIVMWFSSCLPA